MTPEQHERKRAYMRAYNAKIRDQKVAYNKQWYQDHKESAKQAAKEYRLANPDRTREATARWRVANKEYLATYRKDYQDRTRETTSQKARDKRSRLFANDPKMAWFHYAIQAARGRARRFGVPFGPLEGLVFPDTCPVLGIELKYAERRKHPQSDSPSLDRIIPALGYVTSNVRVISWRANVLKRDATVDEIRRVLTYVEASLKETT